MAPLYLTVKTQVKNITHALDPSYYSQIRHITLLIKFFKKNYFETTKASQPIVDLPFPSRRLLRVQFMQQETIF